MDWARERLPNLSWSSRSKSNLPRRVLISYILDYAVLVILFVAFQALDAVEPFHQHFALQNYTLQYPFAQHERVPIALAFALAVVVPVLAIAFYTLVIDGLFSHQQQRTAQRNGSRAIYTLQERLWELNCGILGLLLSEGLAFVITGALKNEIGKPRPDIIDRCRPNEGSVDAPVFGLSNSTICTQTDHGILKDGFRSFPSGHSSSAFAGLFYLSLYLAGKLHVLDNKGEVWKTIIVMVPTLAAALIAGSRIMDSRHHPFDVISGRTLGVVVAWCAYRQYFPPITESWRKGRAHPIRAWGTEPKIPYQQMPRNQSLEDLPDVDGQRGWDDPETGDRSGGLPLQSTSRRLQPQPSFHSSHNHPGTYGAGPQGNPPTRGVGEHYRQKHRETSSSSSVGLEKWRPSPSNPGTSTEAARGRTQARSIRGGHHTFASSTSSLHSHEVEEIDHDMAPAPLSPSKSPQRNSVGFDADTAYHPPPHQIPVAPTAGFTTADDVVESYVCDHCGLKLHGEDEMRNHVHV